MQDFWTVAEIAKAMRWPVYKARRRLRRARVLNKVGRHYLISRDRLRCAWPDLLDALHRRATLSDNEEY